jgi:hypothetical protein
VYFLLHVPKTAGQTLRGHFAEHCAPGLFWEPRRGRDDAQPMAAPARVRAVSGHDLGHSLEGPFVGREIRRIVLLREPLSLQLSLYNYRMMNYLAKGQGTYSFALHLRTLPRDFVAHWLLSRWLEIPWATLTRLSDARKYALLNRALASFWFVGDYTDCDRLIASLAAELGVPDTATPRNTARQWQRQVEWRPLRIEELSSADRCRHPRPQPDRSGLAA